MRLRCLRPLLVLLLLLRLPVPVAAQPAPAPAIVTFLHMNDVYEITPVGGGKAGGLARVATLVKQLRAAQAPAPVLVTLGGDYVSPSALGTARIDGTPLAGRQMVDVLNTVGLQWATLGNHEFDIPEVALRARLSEGRFTVVVSNVTDATGAAFPGTVRTAIVPVDAGGRTLRIGLLGVVVDDLRQPWVKYEPPLVAARAAAASLAGHVDAIVALTHLELEDDARLAETIPEIDVILGGHDHDNWQVRRGAHFTPIVKADANARSVAVVELAFGASGRPVVQTRLQVVDDRIAADVETEAVVRKWTATAFDAFRRDGFTPETTVVTLSEPLDGREATVRHRPGALTQLIANAVRREAGADLGIFNSGSVRIDDILPPGPVSEYDIIRLMPFGGKVLTVRMSGALLARVLDTGLSNEGLGGYLHSSDGVTRTSQGWTVAGAPLDPSRVYTVGISEFLMSGREANMGFLTRTAEGVGAVEERRDIRRAVIEELQRTSR